MNVLHALTPETRAGIYRAVFGIVHVSRKPGYMHAQGYNGQTKRHFAVCVDSYGVRTRCTDAHGVWSQWIVEESL